MWLHYLELVIATTAAWHVQFTWTKGKGKGSKREQKWMARDSLAISSNMFVATNNYNSCLTCSHKQKRRAKDSLQTWCNMFVASNNYNSWVTCSYLTKGKDKGLNLFPCGSSSMFVATYNCVTCSHEQKRKGKGFVTQLLRKIYN